MDKKNRESLTGTEIKSSERKGNGRRKRIKTELVKEKKIFTTSHGLCTVMMGTRGTRGRLGDCTSVSRGIKGYTRRGYMVILAFMTSVNMTGIQGR